MHIVGLIFCPFELEDQCMDVKFVALRVISTLGSQIYPLDEKSLAEIEFMEMDLSGLGKLFLGLGESDSGSPTFAVLGVWLSLEKDSTKLDEIIDLEIMGLDDCMNKLGESQAISQTMKMDATSWSYNSTSHWMKTFLWVRWNRWVQGNLGKSVEDGPYGTIEGELVEFLLDSTSRVGSCIELEEYGLDELVDQLVESS